MSEKNRLLASQFVVEEDVVEARGAPFLEPLQLLAPFLQPLHQVFSFLSSALFKLHSDKWQSWDRTKCTCPFKVAPTQIKTTRNVKTLLQKALVKMMGAIKFVGSLFKQNHSRWLTLSLRSNSSTDGGSRNILRGDMWNGHLQICKNDKFV